MLDRVETDPIIARTKVDQLVAAFLWYATPDVIDRVLIRVGATTGRRVGGLAQWQRAVLINTLGS